MFYIYSNNEIFTLWISEKDNKLSDLAYLSLKSMVLVGHDVKLYTYSFLTNVPEGVEVLDANSILDKSNIFKYRTGFKSYSGFANWFRFKRMYEYGGTWLDLDILLIKNVNEVVADEIAVCSEPGWHNYILPNNAFMRFPKGDELIKKMMEFAEDIGSNARHAQTGPQLVKKMLNSDFYRYNNYLKNFSINNLLGWYEIAKYSKDSESLLFDVNIDEIFGFHFVNTFYSRLNLEEYPSGLYNDLKVAITISNNKEEYVQNLIKFNILKMPRELILKNRDLQYANITSYNDVQFTFIIDMTKLKKVELYTLITSIETNLGKTCEFLVFGKNNISVDSILFKHTLKIFNSDFNKINQEIVKHIGGKYIVLINEPLLFKGNVSEDFVDSDIQLINFNGIKNSKLYVFRRNCFEYFNKFVDLFNLYDIDFNDFNFKFIETSSELILTYGNEFNENELKLMEFVDNFSINGIEDFELTKENISKLFEYNMVEHLSFYYFSKCKNILESETLNEYKLKEEIDCLNQSSNRYLDELRYTKNNEQYKKVL